MTRRATKKDAKDIARIHTQSLPGSFLATLGLHFLISLYEFLIVHEIVYVYCDKYQITGFISGTYNTQGIMKRFICRKPFSLLLILISIILKPKFFFRVIETYSTPHKSEQIVLNNRRIDLPSSELLSIAVHGNAQSRGVGSTLLKSFETELQSKEILSYKVIAGSSLLIANQFYKSNDFILMDQIVIHGKERSNIYIKTL
jgi:ribosomal protein S18 acetylase RimI-like enzyme